MKFCIMCGTQLQDGDAYCPNCGKKVVDYNSQNNNSGSNQQARSNGNANQNQQARSNGHANSNRQIRVNGYANQNQQVQNNGYANQNQQVQNSGYANQNQQAQNNGYANSNQQVQNNGYANQNQQVQSNGYVNPNVQTRPSNYYSTATNGIQCYYHQNENSVSKCSKCGRNLCVDCSDAYYIDSGKYSGSFFCYDCCKNLIDGNQSNLSFYKTTILKQYTMQIIGFFVGFAISFMANKSASYDLTALQIFLEAFLSGIAMGVLFAGIREFFSSLKTTILLCFFGEKGMIAGMIYFIFSLFILSFTCLIKVLIKTFKYISYLIKTKGILKREQEILRNFTDYMDYLVTRNMNPSFSLEQLINYNNNLLNNTYVDMLRKYGADNSNDYLRKEAAEICENYDKIQAFPVVGKQY